MGQKGYGERVYRWIGRGSTAATALLALGFVYKMAELGYRVINRPPVEIWQESLTYGESPTKIIDRRGDPNNPRLRETVYQGMPGNKSKLDSVTNMYCNEVILGIFPRGCKKQTTLLNYNPKTDRYAVHGIIRPDGTSSKVEVLRADTPEAQILLGKYNDLLKLAGE